jgi:hypothetical protein
MQAPQEIPSALQSSGLASSRTDGFIGNRPEVANILHIVVRGEK